MSIVFVIIIFSHKKLLINELLIYVIFLQAKVRCMKDGFGEIDVELEIKA